MKLLQKIRREASMLLEDQQGASMIEYILIIAAIALPVVAILIWFKDDIKEWINEQWTDVKEGDVDTDLD